jgi:acetoin utilization deacetylase AcuC-like enzyme
MPLPPRMATPAELALAHDTTYLERLATLARSGGGWLDAETAVSPGSWDTVCGAVGGGLAAIEALRSGRGEAAFVVARPPGHHAGRAAGRGFCLVNQLAVAAATLSAAGERVAVIDWDVHHGNGTQEIFWTDPSVLYVSVHQWPLYPGTGSWKERGEGPGTGTTVNLPLPPRSTGDVYRALFDEVITPCVERFAPDWVLVSAGFDAHRDDPLAQMRLTAGDYADVTLRTAALAPGASRLLLFLEGGYDLPALQASVAASAAALVGAEHGPEPVSSGGAGGAQVAQYHRLFVDDRPFA